MSCASCITGGIELSCPFSSSEGTSRPYPPKSLPRVRTGKRNVSFPAIRVSPGCSDTDKLDYRRSSASLIAFNSLHKAEQRTVSLQVLATCLEKKAVPVQRAGTYSSSKGKKWHSSFHHNLSLRWLLNSPGLQVHMGASLGGCLTVMQMTQMFPVFFAWAVNR